MVFLSNISYTKAMVFFCFLCASNLNSQVAAMLARCLPTKSRKELDRDVFDTFATFSGLHDVTDTDCGAQHGSTRGTFLRLPNVEV